MFYYYPMIGDNFIKIGSKPDNMATTIKKSRAMVFVDKDELDKFISQISADVDVDVKIFFEIGEI